MWAVSCGLRWVVGCGVVVLLVAVGVGSVWLVSVGCGCWWVGVLGKQVVLNDPEAHTNQFPNN